MWLSLSVILRIHETTFPASHRQVSARGYRHRPAAVPAGGVATVLASLAADGHSVCADVLCLPGHDGEESGTAPGHAAGAGFAPLFPDQVALHSADRQADKNEEEVLEKGLEGYKEYKQKVKYKVIPFIW